MVALELSLSTFLGFLSALLLEYLVKKYEEIGLYKNIVRGITKELKGIKDRLSKLQMDSFYVNPLDMSYWESMLHSNNMNCLLKHPLYNDIVTTYQYIENVNQWENLRTTTYFTNGISAEALNVALGKQRNELSKEIEALLDRL